MRRARSIRRLWVAAIVAVAIGLSASAEAESGSSKSLSAIADDFYWVQQDRAIRPNFSPQSNAAWVKKLKKLEYRLARVKKAKLGPEARITYRMLQRDLKQAREYVTKGHIQRDINGSASPLHVIADSADGSMYKTVNDWKWAIKTLKNSQPFMKSYIANLEAGIRSGNLQTREAIQSSISSLEILTSASKTKNPFRKLEAAMARSLKGKKQLPAMRKELRAVIEDNVLPSHRQLKSFLKNSYLPKAGKLGRSRSNYLYAMKQHLGPGHDSPEAIHKWGRAEVRRLHRELEKTARKMNPKAKTLASFMNGFNRRKSNSYRDARDFIGSSKKEIARARELARAKIPIPRSSIDVKSVAPHQEATVAAQYYPNGPGKGVMELNTGKLLKGQRRSDLATLITHEVYAGHHLAAMYAQKQTHLPLYRSEAARTAFDEGWGLYTEQLRDEQKAFTPEERVGYLVNHLWRAARLVVDTGLHTGTMTPSQARRYFQKSTFVTPDTARSEISRYIDWPGQALAYYVGKRQFLDIRKRVVKMLGKKFDERKFHAKLLSLGSIPTHELKIAMTSWAKRRGAQLDSKKKVVRNLRRRAPSRTRQRKRTQRQIPNRWRTRGRFGTASRTRGAAARAKAR
ncbi:MAG: DUF885 domain-containing protein [Deltaproteobacteria bacterium]|nr:DUF885 domain-containing protein [Deltaproteobacteria bacterium]